VGNLALPQFVLIYVKVNTGSVMELILHIANGLMGLAMLVTAVALWKIRRYRLLKGGDAAVLLALVALAVDRWAMALQIDALSTFTVPIAAGLTITAAVVLCSFAPSTQSEAETTCILSKEGRRHCHLAMIAEVVGEPELSDAYRDLVDEARAKQAEKLKDA
jgi:hypothetical protein